MIKVGGLFFPDGEKHFAKFGDSILEYGMRDRQAAYRYVRQWRRALDIGANVGIFSCEFASRFEHVVAFEPVPRTRECLVANVPPNVQVEPFAIADKEGVLNMYPTVVNCGGSFISNHPEVMTPEVEDCEKRQIEVEVRTIDSYDFNAVDLMKLDIQGAEHLALMGAKETILRHRPVVLVEQKAVNAEHLHIIKSHVADAKVVGDEGEGDCAVGSGLHLRRLKYPLVCRSPRRQWAFGPAYRRATGSGLAPSEVNRGSKDM